MDPIQNHGLGWGPSVALEHTLADFETYTNENSLIPIYGTALAVVKLALGVIQVLGGLVVALVAGTLSLCGIKNAKETSQRGVSHLVNGMANIGASIVQATWIGGIILDQGARQLPGAEPIYSDTESRPCRGRTGQDKSFVGYKVLNEHPHYYNEHGTNCTHRNRIISDKRDYREPNVDNPQYYTAHRPWVLV